jgi:hypothetical protein
LRVKKLFSDKDNLALSKKFRKFVVLSYTIYCIDGEKQFSPQAEPKTRKLKFTQYETPELVEFGQVVWCSYHTAHFRCVAVEG